MASSDPIECNTDTINTLTDCLRANGLGEASEGAIQYIPDQGLVLDAYNLGPVPLSEPKSTYISGRNVNVAVASGAPPGGRLNISTLGTGAGGDVAVGEGFNISNNVLGSTQTICHGLPTKQLSTIKSTLDFASQSGDKNRLTFFEDDPTITTPPVAVGYTRAGRPAITKITNIEDVIDRVNKILNTLAIYGLITGAEGGEEGGEQ